MHPVLATFTLFGQEVVLRAYGTFYVLAWVIALVTGLLMAWRVRPEAPALSAKEPAG